MQRLSIGRRMTQGSNLIDNKIPVKLLRKQWDFLNSKSREVLYSGAFGAGKTRALCVKLVARAWHPGAREYLVRKSNVSLKRSTLKTLLEPDGDLSAVLPAQWYKHNKQDQIIRIYGGGEIMYSGLDDPEKLGSIPATGVAVDEAVELNEEDWIALRGRIRVRNKGDTLQNQLYGACNPGPPSHFLAERFGLALNFKPKRGCFAIRTESKDNFFLPKDYLDDLNSLTGVAYKRFVRGLWVGSDGLVYDKFERDRHVQHRPITEFPRVIIGQDEGYTNPAVLIVVGIDNDNRLHILREWYESKRLEVEVIAKAQEFHNEFLPESFIIDPSAAKLIAAMEVEGLPVEKADNRVFGGIQKVQSLLRFAGDERPRLTISPECGETIREFETYEWMKGKDKPRKQFDHAMDAVRYAVAYADEPGVQVEVI